MATATATPVEIVRFAPGQSQPVPAREVHSELERIRVANDGTLRPRDVVQESRPEDATLHPCFEWDDQVAAEQYRENQARSVIRSVRVIRTDQPDRPAQPIYLHVRADDPKEQRYLRTMDALSDEEMRARVLTEALAQLQSWQRKYGQLQELADLAAMIARASATVAA